MRISRKPTGARFFELFAEIGANIGASVEVLREFVRAPVERRPELAARMHALENVGDDATHAIFEHLDRSFVTPFDREDIYRLTSRLDDVVDHMDAAADLTTLYHLGELPEGVETLVDLLCQAARLTAEVAERRGRRRCRALPPGHARWRQRVVERPRPAHGPHARPAAQPLRAGRQGRRVGAQHARRQRPRHRHGRPR
ncbi:DUF47 family protein [Lentzea sp. BCCO 10_0798]|uniref:DUF47 family protein n=1 Tax=Lentzea kristufekii TaxID=3095430 RepID=A0ABU4TRM6_9PSEU|nr:DUF47 family protein [Lentzea sp. BCCO 10_0798]MDX8050865.1 DUF47 family protein [Lentzea sp. BCCO 10_0798]